MTEIKNINKINTSISKWTYHKARKRTFSKKTAEELKSLRKKQRRNIDIEVSEEIFNWDRGVLVDYVIDKLPVINNVNWRHFDFGDIFFLKLKGKKIETYLTFGVKENWTFGFIELSNYTIDKFTNKQIKEYNKNWFTVSFKIWEEKRSFIKGRNKEEMAELRSRIKNVKTWLQTVIYNLNTKEQLEFSTKPKIIKYIMDYLHSIWTIWFRYRLEKTLLEQGLNSDTPVFLNHFVIEKKENYIDNPEAFERKKKLAEIAMRKIKLITPFGRELIFYKLSKVAMRIKIKTTDLARMLMESDVIKAKDYTITFAWDNEKITSKEELQYPICDICWWNTWNSFWRQAPNKCAKCRANWIKQAQAASRITRKGFLSEVYDRQKFASNNTLNYSKEDFIHHFLSNEEFNELFEKWSNNDYLKKYRPRIEKIKTKHWQTERIPYILDNLYLNNED